MKHGARLAVALILPASICLGQVSEPTEPQAGARLQPVVVKSAAGQPFTGCLSTSGSLYNIALGLIPRAACSGGDKQVSWSQIGQTGPQGPAGTGQVLFRFVGITTQRFLSEGPFAMNSACAAQFPGSRMAFSDEITYTVNPPPIPEEAWVQFRPVGAYVNNYYLFDSAGNRLNAEAATGGLNCLAWTGGGSGSVVDTAGRVVNASCNKTRPVACATP